MDTKPNEEREVFTSSETTKNPTSTLDSDNIQVLFAKQHVMRGVGFDIANSKRLNENEKSELIKACEALFFSNIPLQQCHKHLLWKVRKKYHIMLCGLDSQAEPSSFIDKILY